MLYCVKYSNANKYNEFNSMYTGFFKPWNAVRDDVTFSLTYLPTSVINGIEDRIGIPFDSILRNKLTFNKNGMATELVKTTHGTKWENGIPKDICIKELYHGKHLKHCLVNPEIIFGFDNKDHAEKAFNTSLYLGQTEYPIYPSGTFGIQEMTDADFDELPGVETVPSNSGVFCGFNRFKNNEKQYVDIIRKEWD